MSKISVTTLQAARTVVIKFGSNVVKDATNNWRDSLAANTKALIKAGKRIVLVSSGAGAEGRKALHLAEGELSIEDKQAATIAGQPILMKRYSRSFNKHGLCAGQVLLTNMDFRENEARRNSLNAINAFLRLGGVPIINENDATATDEIRVGDNDNLAAKLAKALRADALIIFSTIDGFFKNYPSSHDLYETITDLEGSHWAAAGDAPEGVTTGGMKTKLMAASTCMQASIPMIITNGRSPNCLRDIFQNADKRCTLFLPTRDDFQDSSYGQEIVVPAEQSVVPSYV